MENESVKTENELRDYNKYLEDENANLKTMLNEYKDNIE
jgi:hypothetical protein